MSDRTLSDSDLRALHAYHDGELNPLSRWWVERRLARSARLRAELAEIREVGDWVRHSADSGPAVDLWDAIALRLPAADARRGAGSEAAPGRGWRERSWLGAPLFAAAATAAVAVAVVLGTIGDQPVRDARVVRWLDTGGRSVIVLDEPEGATIVWLLESPSEGAARGGRGESV